MIQVKQDLIAALGAAILQVSPQATVAPAFESPKAVAHGDLACTVAMLPIVLGYSTGAIVYWALFVGFAAFGSLSYPLLATRFTVDITGRVVTAVNLVTFSMAFIVQFGVGAIINLWPVIDGHYAVDGYRSAFALCWGLQVVAVAWLWYAERGAMRRTSSNERG